MSARALAVLDRFPQYLAATDPGKRFGAVVGALADPLDVQTRQLGEVRKAHRIGEVPARADLLGLAALHAISLESLEPLRRRLAALAAAGTADPVDPAAIEAQLGLPDDSLTGLEDEQLAALTAAPARHRALLQLQRSVVLGVIGAHKIGNGTARALLAGTAAYLCLDLEDVTHTADRWWHLARCRDRIRVTTPDGGSPEPEPDLLALEENPFRSADLDPTPKRHGEAFHVLRGGLEDVDATVRVRGVGARTVRPMVVQVYAGRGLIYEGSVPDGVELRFEASGRVRLDTTDVTGSAWSFEGAVFASRTATLPAHDFLFADADADADRDADTDADSDANTGAQPERAARFVTTAPLADGLSPSAAYPHGAAAVGPLTLPVGQSRWAAFVRAAHAVDAVAGAAPVRHTHAQFDSSVFAEAVGPDGVTTGADSVEVGFAWQEREPFAVRVLLPRRLRAADDEAGTLLRRPVRALLDRHRAAGIDVRVEYADPRWTLGTGVIRDAPDQALGTVLSGTELWPDPPTGPDAHPAAVSRPEPADRRR